MSQYVLIPEEEINEAAGEDPQRALLMLMANSNLSEAATMADGQKPHQPEFHKEGWSIAIETQLGVVGLWSCWLGDGFYLGYPKWTSFLIDALPSETIIAIANQYRREHADEFLVPPEGDLDLEESRRLLVSMKEIELMGLLRGIKKPPWRDEASVSDELIMKTLGVKIARPVRQVDAVAVTEDDDLGRYMDHGKPLARNKAGQIIAYKERHEPRTWAKFYGPRCEGGQGRVWIDHSGHNSLSYHFGIIRDGTPEGLADVYYGHSYSRGISTYPYSHWNIYSPDGPTTDRNAIQGYRERFIALACEIARIMGGATAVNIDYGFVIVPEQLAGLGYRNITWLKGQAGVREGWGKEVVRADRVTETGKEEVVLKSGNSLVPWSTIRRVQCPDGLDAARLNELLLF